MGDCSVPGLFVRGGICRSNRPASGLLSLARKNADRTNPAFGTVAARMRFQSRMHSRKYNQGRLIDPPVIWFSRFIVADREVQMAMYTLVLQTSLNM